MTVIPAYGRDYTTQRAVKADWKSGKDFIVADMFSGAHGRYVNKEDAKGMHIMVRYDKLRKIVNV